VRHAPRHFSIVGQATRRVGVPYYPAPVRPDEREVVERSIRRVTEQAAKANEIVAQAMDAGLDGSSPLVVNMKMIRAELLSVKDDLERELEREVLNCVVCGVPAHYVGGLGVRAGRSHAEPAPHDTPKIVLNP
jgi:hypothetical protein